MEALGPSILMSAGSTVLQGAGSIIGGNAKGGALDARAAAYRVAGNQAFASSQRAGFNELRKGKIVASNAVAAAAAGGGGAADPSTINILAGIEGQSSYNAMSALYEGQEQKRVYDTQATLDENQAGQERMAGWMNAGSTVIDGTNSLWEKYGKKLGAPAAYG